LSLEHEHSASKKEREGEEVAERETAWSGWKRKGED